MSLLDIHGLHLKFGIDVCDRYGDRLSLAIVADMEAPGAFDEAVAKSDITGVIHTASPFHYPVDDNARDLFHPAVNGTLRILEAVKKNGPNVDRIVITSSFAAVLDVNAGLRPGYTYTEKDWNPIGWEEAKTSAGSVAYCASKEFAERAAWEFVEKQKPTFTITTLCPPMVYGPNGHFVDSLKSLNSSSANIWNLINGSQKEVPPTGFPACVDVRDLAEAHVRALTYPEAAGQRYIVAGTPFTFQQIADIVRADYPQLRDKVPEGNPGEPLPAMYVASNEKIKEELGMQFRPLKEIVHASVDSLLEIMERLGDEA